MGAIGTSLTFLQDVKSELYVLSVNEAAHRITETQ